MRNRNEETRNGNEEMRLSMGKFVHASQKLASSLYRFLFGRNHGRTDTL